MNVKNESGVEFEVVTDEEKDIPVWIACVVSVLFGGVLFGITTWLLS